MINLIQGDCLEEMDKLIEQGVVVDAIICDPPYGTTACKWDSVIPFDAMWERLNKLIKPNGAIVLFGSEPFSSALRISNIKNYKYDWVWEKNIGTGFLNAKIMPLKFHENISVFYKKQCTYNPQKTTGHKRKISLATHKRNCIKTDIYGNHNLHSYNSTERYPKSIQFFKVVKKTEQLMPTQKPTPLLSYLIKTYTDEGEIVLDFATGTGSTGVSCIKINRNFIGIEKNGKRFNIAKNRINNEIDKRKK